MANILAWAPFYDSDFTFGLELIFFLQETSKMPLNPPVLEQLQVNQQQLVDYLVLPHLLLAQQVPHLRQVHLVSLSNKLVLGLPTKIHPLVYLGHKTTKPNP